MVSKDIHAYRRGFGHKLKVEYERLAKLAEDLKQEGDIKKFESTLLTMRNVTTRLAEELNTILKQR